MNRISGWKIIAEQRTDHWFVWFEHCPRITCTGCSAWQTVGQLMELFGWDNFDIERASLSGTARDGYLEFTVPLLNYRRTQAPSLN